MLVIFPFEKLLYQEEKEGMDVHFVGHPLKDTVVAKHTKKAFFQKVGLDPDKPTVGLLPGSRYHEVRSLLPEMVKAVNLLRKELPDLQSLMGKAPTLDEEVFTGYRVKKGFQASIRDNAYDVMAHVDIVVVASGTATLETAIIGTPMVILYKMSPLSYIIGRILVRVKNIGLVNIVAGDEIVPELIQRHARAEKIAEKVLDYLNDDQKYGEVKTKLKAVSKRLGEEGGSMHAAECVLDFIDGLATP